MRVRLERELVEQLDAWIARQPEDADRSEAIRAMVAAVLEVVDRRDEGGEAGQPLSRGRPGPAAG